MLLANPQPLSGRLVKTSSRRRDCKSCSRVASRGLGRKSLTCVAFHGAGPASGPDARPYKYVGEDRNIDRPLPPWLGEIPVLGKAAEQLLDTIDQKQEETRRQTPQFGAAEWIRHRKSHIARASFLPSCMSVFLVVADGAYDALHPAGWPGAPAFHVGILSLTDNRFDEARKAWGSLVNRTRDIMRQAAAFFPQESSKRALIRWTGATTHCLRLQLLEPRSLDPEERWSDDPAAPAPASLRAILTPDECRALSAAPHRTLFCMQVLTQIVATSGAEVALLRGMDEDLKLLEDCVGACERIYKTPVPLSYTYHTSRFLVFWLFFLPFTLYTELGWGALPLAPVLTFLIFGVAEIAIDLEEPFSILPLDAICAKIVNEGKYLLASDSTVKALVKSELSRGGSGEQPLAAEGNNGSAAADAAVIMPPGAAAAR